MLLSCAFQQGVFADQLVGKVVSISDGDTLRVVDHARQQHKIRLIGIDAPEKHQPFGSTAKTHLTSLCFGKEVVVDWAKYDRYRRIIGQVWCDSQDAGLAQIEMGMAWWYEVYAKEQTPRDRGLYSRAQGDARRSRIGLWHEHDPTPPWIWRRNLKRPER